MIPKFFTKPHSSTELRIFNHLHSRMKLSKKDLFKMNQLRKGYDGEKTFFNLLRKNLPKQSIVLNNLLLEYDETEFQIDSLLIFENSIYLFEVKNYAGDFFIQNDRWFLAHNESEIRNPLSQLQRTELLFRRLLRNLNYSFKVSSYLIFINSEFTLYQAPLINDIILPTQINKFVTRLSSLSFRKLQTHDKLIKQLTSRHLNTSENVNFPFYHFDTLKKGILCTTCFSFLKRFNRDYFICKTCNEKILLELAILNSIKEFKLLFPYKKITTSNIYHWCRLVNYKGTIRNVLSKYCDMFNGKQHAYYVLKNNHPLDMNTSNL